MSGLRLTGPMFTYVTDGDLALDAQQRILRDFVGCAESHRLRVAFRLPRWRETDIRTLLEWYLQLLDDEGLANVMEPSLVHDHPEVADLYENVGLWLPWRNRDLVTANDVGRLTMSVHSEREAHEAIFLGASELVFGHVFRSESHPGEPGRGVDELVGVKDSVQSYATPPRVTAIGGIDEYTIPEIGAIRHHSVAAIRVISRSADIAMTLSRLSEIWLGARINADLDDEQRTPFNRPSSVFF